MIEKMYGIYNMNEEIEQKLTQLQKTFAVIIDARLDVTNTLSSLHTVILKLTHIYGDLIKTNQEKIFVFGLDSFRFQCKLIDMEYDDMKRLFLLMNNRMYCEYFKLYKIISEYVSDNIADKDFLSSRQEESYPVYKDLEPFKNYEFELIQAVHESIVTMLLGLHSYYLNRSHDLKNYKLKNGTGLNIDNFVLTFEHNITAMREKIVLFIQYMEFFHKLHKKYLKRFATKLHLMTSLINNDIKFEDTTKEKQRNLLEEIGENELDNEILLEVKESVQDNILKSPSQSSESVVEAEDDAVSCMTTSEKSENLVDADYAVSGADAEEEVFKPPTFSDPPSLKKRPGRKKKNETSN